MSFSDESYNLRIELDQKGCELTADQIERMEESLDTLRKLVERFPVSNLYITVIHHERSADYHVKTSLALTGKTLFTGDRDDDALPAFDRCVRKLVQKVRAYRAKMEQDEELAKQAAGTHQMVAPTSEFDLEQIEQAVQEMDYPRFRQSLLAFETPLRERIGRWLQRYPELESRLGGDLEIADVVEEVFLNAFEQFPNRSSAVPPGDWLESLIDPSVQAILQSPDEEFAAISFARSMRDLDET